MSAYSYAYVFAEDLVMYLTKHCNIAWQPEIHGLMHRSNGCLQYQPGFTNNIGAVVMHFFHTQCRTPPESNFTRMRDAHGYLYNKLFKYGNDFFNVLDYCGQLFWSAVLLHQKGYRDALDLCVVYIAVTISNLMRIYGISGRIYWNKLQRTADTIKISVPAPIYYILEINHTRQILVGKSKRVLVCETNVL